MTDKKQPDISLSDIHPQLFDKIASDLDVKSIGNWRKTCSFFRDKFTKVLQAKSLDIQAIACGFHHTLILTTDGKVYAAGKNDSGQLGSNNTADQPSFQPIPNLPPIKVIAADGYFSLFLDISGKLYFSGTDKYSFFGPLNEAITTPKHINRFLAPVKTMMLKTQFIVQLENDDIFVYNAITNSQQNFAPIQWDSLRNSTNKIPQRSEIKTISTGSKHYCILYKDGSLYGVGDNAYGQIGETETMESYYPSLITKEVETVVTGENHTIFMKAGKLYGLGSNFSGQLGIEEQHGNRVNKPMEITGIKGKITAIAAGSFSTLVACNNTLWGFGSNANHVLGFETTTYHPKPEIITTFDANIKLLTIGWKHSFVLLENNTLYCFGNNDSGQLGLKSKHEYPTLCFIEKTEAAPTTRQVKSQP